MQGFHRTDEAAFLLRTLPVWAWAVMQYSTLVFEIGAPLWFSIRRIRWAVIGYGVGFHLMIALLMKRVCFFSFIMISFYPLFISADEWRRLGRMLGRACGRDGRLVRRLMHKDC